MSKWVKKCPSPYRTRYKCYFYELCHMRGGEDVKVTPFHISPKFTLFWWHTGENGGSKWVKMSPFPYKTRYVIFREYVTREVGGEGDTF